MVPWNERWGVLGHERRGFEGIKRMVGGQKNEGQGGPQLGGLGKEYKQKRVD